MEITEEVNNWLLESNPWVEYNTRLEIMKQSSKNPKVAEAKETMIKHH